MVTKNRVAPKSSMLTLAFALLACPPIIAEDGKDYEEKCPPYIWISLGEQTRKKDGALVQRYHVRSDNGASEKFDESIDLRAFYRLSDYASRKVEIYAATITKSDNKVFLDIESATNSRVWLFVVGECQDRFYTAQIANSIFGRAASDSRKPGRLAEDFPPNWPRLHPKPSRLDYYMQTGHAYRFNYSAKGSEVKKARILENGKVQEQVALGQGGDLAFTPPHDISLDRAGSYAHKETVVLVQEAADGKVFSTTHTLVLHRAIYAHSNLNQGLILLGATVALFSLFVVYKRRFGNDPWFSKSD